MSKPKIETYLGELDLECVFENSLGFFAVTGQGLNQRTWHITKQEYEKLKAELGDE